MEVNNKVGLVSNASTVKSSVSGAKGASVPSQNSYNGYEVSLASRAYATPQISSQKNVHFEGHYDKIVEKIKTAPDPAKVKLSIDEALTLLKHCGYSFRHNGGSHIVASCPNQRPMTIVSPHGHEKSVHPETVKEIRRVLNSQPTLH